MIDTAITVEKLNAMAAGTMISYVGIEFIALTDDFIKARMPVDKHTRQPLGALHGGATATLAETLGSAGSVAHLGLDRKVPVGLELNINHIRPVTSGYVIGMATALHLGRRTHVWEIKIVDDADRLVSVGRLTMMMVAS